MGVAGLRILVADDEALIREALVELLGTTSHTVTAVSDGQAAIDLLRRDCVDLVFTDVFMPRATGDQVLEVAMTLDDPPRVVILTGKEAHTSESEFLSMGAFAYMRKPYRMSEILTLTRQVEAERAQGFAD